MFRRIRRSMCDGLLCLVNFFRPSSIERPTRRGNISWAKNKNQTKRNRTRSIGAFGVFVDWSSWGVRRVALFVTLTCSVFSCLDAFSSRNKLASRGEVSRCSSQSLQRKRLFYFAKADRAPIQHSEEPRSLSRHLGKANLRMLFLYLLVVYSGVLCRSWTENRKKIYVYRTCRSAALDVRCSIV